MVPQGGYEERGHGVSVAEEITVKERMDDGHHSQPLVIRHFTHDATATHRHSTMY